MAAKKPRLPQASKRQRKLARVANAYREEIEGDPRPYHTQIAWPDVAAGRQARTA